MSATLRVPGRFELLPSARREYRAILPGRAELFVRQYDVVVPGQLLARLDSPEWRRIQHEAIEAEGEIKVAEANVDVAEATRAENDRAAALARRRVELLAEANARRAELEAELAGLESKTVRLGAEVRAARVKLAEAREHFASKLTGLASVTGLPVQRLSEPVPAELAATRPAATARATGPAGADHAAAEAVPLWRTLDFVELRATQAGVVDTVAVTSGGWVDAPGIVLTTADPTQLRFRAVALQSDLVALADGAAASIVSPRGTGGAARTVTSTTAPAAAPSTAPSGPRDPHGALPGRVSLATEADPATRTIDLIVTPDHLAPWARPGVSTFAEVVTDGSADAEPAIPLAAVVQDELERVYFRRDPRDPDKVVRVAGDFGVSDGRWVVVQSGVKAGDEVVLDGVYELKLAGLGKPGRAGGGAGGGGHFHADGTWHADGTPEKK